MLTAPKPGFELSLPAPAKLNLFLHIVGRRPDGYHLLQTAFRFIDFADTLHFRLRTDNHIRRLNDIPGVPEEQDLVVRAARLLQQYTGCRLGAEIEIEKKLPMGGGLGGGSSDAATALLALNKLWQLNLPREQLQEIGLQLGADVPVFIFGHNAFAEGVGEQLQEIQMDEAWYVVIIPPVQVPTAKIFSSERLTRNTPVIKVAAFPDAPTRNDLQPVVCEQYQEVNTAIKMLSQFGEAKMSGSGACVFVELKTRQAAENVVKSLSLEIKSVVARGLDGHPLLSM
ncbi:4-diphosphocytidyl-2-C-methyl-D-erythritol kinase [Chitinivorax tropicus]|uniref:4-diphosphocytidyl-2-C-methyl-D-erythritol kinase n=1 Tax=Chitinivorax tropicus TaxID=714531 RepID=A0A840MN67_9PROT|nr:4-(cytidine 5'-diphospho)-2-C-methyl-D-erythritol kinase [Chitinivorax tropicus]MBB5018417.1 4-diphosphocytidyl-2-C-methyl-D-erythritol kinase [Chitinivorax tropicus]